MKINQRKHAIATLLLLIALTFSGCAAKINTTLPQTALTKTIVYNYATSEANHTVGRTIRELNAAGSLTDAQAKPIITGTVRIATMSDSIRAITSQGTEAGWSVDGPKVRKLIADAGGKLPNSGNKIADMVIEIANAALLLLSQGVQ